MTITNTARKVAERYDLARKPEHSTLGASLKRHRRDPDAFAAGAQHALDTLLSRTEELLGTINPSIQDFITGSAAEILHRIHTVGPQ